MAAVDFIVVGCGCPKRGMGWYHIVQMLDMPEASLRAVVEPWYLGAGSEAPGSTEFKQFAEDLKARGVAVVAAVADVPKLAAKACALIAGRAADNPRLFEECIAAGAMHIYLEKPGATSVAALEGMRKIALEKNIKVYLGYNKNVTKYVSQAREFEASAGPGARMTFIHNNAYKESELGECFERNSEGMLKNMAVHELCLLATFYGVTPETIDTVTADKDYSNMMTIGKFRDFAKIGFTIRTKAGKSVTVKADRCGGSCAFAIVATPENEAAYTAQTPDDELSAKVEKQAAEDPAMMPYFFLQSDDYLTLKSRVCKGIAADTVPEGVATIDVAIDTLKLAEYLTPLLQEQLA